MWGMVGSTRRSHQARCPHCWHVYNFVSKSAHKDSIHKFIHLGRAARSCSLLWIEHWCVNAEEWTHAVGRPS